MCAGPTYRNDLSPNATPESQIRLELYARMPGWQPPSIRMMLISGGLFVLTLLTTLLVGTVHMLAFLEHPPPGIVLGREWSLWQTIWHQPSILLLGIPYAVPLMLILLSHELGHYLVCRRYDVDATLPFFLPAPSLIGTFGAFIRIRSLIPDRKALIDIGAAGPLIGFTVTLPFLVLGILWSRPVASDTFGHEAILFGEPLIWKILTALLRNDPPGTDLLMHPIGLAAWFGLLATNLNLFPIGQLDGGHVAYALWRRRARWVGRGLWLVLVGLAIHNYVWIAWTVLTLFIGFWHPPTVWDDRPPDRKRRIVAWLSFAVFILTFMPDPIRLVP